MDTGVTLSMAVFIVVRACGCDSSQGDRKQIKQVRMRKQHKTKINPTSATWTPHGSSFSTFKLAPKAEDRVFELPVSGFPIQTIAESPSQVRQGSPSCALGLQIHQLWLRYLPLPRL